MKISTLMSGYIGEPTRGLHGSLQGRAGEGRRCQVGIKMSGIYHEM